MSCRIEKFEGHKKPDYLKQTKTVTTKLSCCLNTFNAHSPTPNRQAWAFRSWWKQLKTPWKEKVSRIFSRPGAFLEFTLVIISRSRTAVWVFPCTPARQSGEREKKRRMVWVQSDQSVRGGSFTFTWSGTWCLPSCAVPQQSQKSLYATLSSCSQLNPGWRKLEVIPIKLNCSCLKIKLNNTSF